MGNVMENSEKNTNINIEHIKKVYFWRSAFFGLVILVAGIAIGGAVMSILAANKETPNQAREYESLMPRLTRILGLKQPQINKIKPILDGHMQHLQEIREDARFDIVNTLEQMNREIFPILGENQKIVWQQELLRIQRGFIPEPPRAGVAAGRRRGAEQPGQGARRNARGQLLQQRQVQGPRRGIESQPPPASPNSPLNNIIQNEIPSGNLEPNDVNE
jgi:hypothetical protein